MRISRAAFGASILLVSPAAFAADPQPAAPPVITLVRGTVDTFDGKTLVVKSDKGPVTAMMGPQTPVSGVEKRTFDQLKSDDFVGITSVPGKNGHLQAAEIHIIPVKGIGEGTYPWDRVPGKSARKVAGSMTNGSIAPQTKTAGSMTNGTMAKGDSAWQLKVTYRASEMVDGKCVGRAPTTPTGGCVGSSIVDVSPSTVIVAIVPAKATDLKPGLQIFGSTLAAPDGKTYWASVVTEKNGVKPVF